MAETILEHYTTLGVKRGATLRQVRRAYRKLAMKHHPDRGGNAERMAQINVAFETILANHCGSRAIDDREPRERVQVKPKKTVDRSDFIPARATRVEFREPGMRTVTVGFHWGPEQIEAARLALRGGHQALR